MAKTTTNEAAEGVDEAAAVEEQLDAEESASEKRARQQEQAMGRKGYEGELPPGQKTVRGETAYSRERLIAAGDDFLGYPSHVVAGAFHGQPDEYLTLDQARKRIEDWLQTPVTEG